MFVIYVVMLMLFVYSLYQKYIVCPNTRATVEINDDLRQELVDVAYETIKKNLPYICNDLDLVYDEDFIVKIEEFTEKTKERTKQLAVCGFTSFTQDNGRWVVRLFYNVLYSDAKVLATQHSITNKLAYVASVAEILAHELKHVKQFEEYGLHYVKNNIPLIEREAEAYSHQLGVRGVYKL